MAEKKNTEGLAFLVETLKKNRDATYADAKVAAEKKGLTVWPIMFGKAKLMLGHVKAGKGTSKTAMKRRGSMKATKATMPGRGPGRPRKNVATASVGAGLDGIVQAVRSSQVELQRFRSAIEKIQQVIETALA